MFYIVILQNITALRSRKGGGSYRALSEYRRQISLANGTSSLKQWNKQKDEHETPMTRLTLRQRVWDLSRLIISMLKILHLNNTNHSPIPSLYHLYEFQTKFCGNKRWAIAKLSTNGVFPSFRSLQLSFPGRQNTWTVLKEGEGNGSIHHDESLVAKDNQGLERSIGKLFWVVIQIGMTTSKPGEKHQIRSRQKSFSSKT